MLLFLSPHEYCLIHASLFPQVRLAVCCLLSKSLKHLKELSSPWSLTATSPWLPPELGHQLLQDISCFQLSPANTDVWKEALEKSESCSHLFFRICRVLVPWCSKAYLVSFSFWLLAPHPVWQTGLLAPLCVPEGPVGTTCWTCCKLHCSLELEHLPAAVPCRACLSWEHALTPLRQQIQHSTAAGGSWATETLTSHLHAGEVTSSSGCREGPFHSLKIWGPEGQQARGSQAVTQGLISLFPVPGFLFTFFSCEWNLHEVQISTGLEVPDVGMYSKVSGFGQWLCTAHRKALWGIPHCFPGAPNSPGLQGKPRCLCWALWLSQLCLSVV